MKVIQQYPFQFADEIFSIYWTDERILILPLRELCDTLGLAFSNQLQRVKRDVVLAEHLHMVRIPVVRPSDGVTTEKEVACISYRRLDYWLGTIDHMRVKADLQPRVIRFKKEMADAIYAYFRTQRLPEDVLAELDVTLPPEERRFHKLMDEAATIKIQVDEHKVRLEGLEDRVIKLEARLLATDVFSDEQLEQYLKATATLGMMLMEKNPSKKPRMYAIVHDATKSQFHVSSYYLLKAKDFDRVMEFLAAWWRREAPERPVPQIFLSKQNRLF